MVRKKMSRTKCGSYFLRSPVFNKWLWHPIDGGQVNGMVRRSYPAEAGFIRGVRRRVPWNCSHSASI